MIQLFVRHLYLRISLPSLAGVAVVAIAAGRAWQIAAEQRSPPLPLPVPLRHAARNPSGRVPSLRPHSPAAPAAV